MAVSVPSKFSQIWRFRVIRLIAFGRHRHDLRLQMSRCDAAPSVRKGPKMVAYVVGCLLCLYGDGVAVFGTSLNLIGRTLSLLVGFRTRQGIHTVIIVT